MPAKAKGTRYRVLRDITYPTDPDIIKRLQAGAEIPLEDRHMTHRVAGNLVHDIPSVSIDWLLAQGYIEPVEEAG